MTAQHMIEHLISTFELSIGKIEAACSTSEKLLPRVKTFLHNNKETPHNFKNPLLGENPSALQYTNFAEAKTVLLEELDRFLEHFQSHLEAVHIHPLFGPLGKDEWQGAHFKHCYHHVLQFNIIKEAEKETNQPKVKHQE